MFFFYLYGAHRDLHVLTPSFPTRRSSYLPHVARARARGNDDPRLRQPRRPGSRVGARGGNRDPPALLDPQLRRADEAVAPAETLGNRPLLVRRSLCDRRNAAPLRGRRRGGHGAPLPPHPHPPVTTGRRP